MLMPMATLTEINKKMIAEFNEKFTYKRVPSTSRSSRTVVVWGFVVNTDNDKKFKKGDILKAAGYAAPARNFARGNILEGGYTKSLDGSLIMKKIATIAIETMFMLTLFAVGWFAIVAS